MDSNLNLKQAIHKPSNEYFLPFEKISFQSKRIALKFPECQNDRIFRCWSTSSATSHARLSSNEG